MAFKPPVAIYDACVLYPFHLRNLLVQCAVDRVVDARWTDEIHNEWIHNLSANNPEIPQGRFYAARDLMNAAVPTANVTGYRAIIPSIALPDPDDCHVVAAGVMAGASVILTWNLRDFLTDELRKHGLRKQTPDVFLTGLYKQIPNIMVEVTRRARSNLRKSKVSAEDFLGALRRQKLIRFTTEIERHLSRL